MESHINSMNAGSYSGTPGILKQDECSAGSC